MPRELARFTNHRENTMTARSRPRPPTGHKFIIGSDHAGYDLKEKVKEYLTEKGNEVEDHVEEFQETIDFGPVAEHVAKAVAQREGTYGILMCGTGLAMSITANKVRGVRAALLYDEQSAEYARRHNDANVLVFGGRTMEFEDVRKRLDAFFDAEFEGGKYARRNEYISRMDAQRNEETPPSAGSRKPSENA